MKKTIGSLILAILIFLSLPAIGYDQASDLAPDFTLKDLTGQNVKLSSYRGKPVLLTFTTTWCPSCRAELPQLISIYSQYKDRGLVMFDINIMEPHAKVLNFSQKRGINYPVLLDNDGKVANSYGVIGVPSKIIVDRKGQIICWNCPTFEDKLKKLMR
jgi:peroxiredoxin